MKYIITGVLAGVALAAVIGAVTYFTFSMNAFLLTVVVLGVTAFLPLIVKSFTSKKVPMPTVYGTSAPGKFTTVGSEEAERRKEGKTLKYPLMAASAGAGLLIIFFVGAIIYLS